MNYGTPKRSIMCEESKNPTDFILSDFSLDMKMRCGAHLWVHTCRNLTLFANLFYDD